jgi:hypothetical protein
MEEMHVPLGEVMSTLQRPACDYPTRPSSAGAPCRAAVGGRLVVIYTDDEQLLKRVIITVLWAGRDSRHQAA